MALSANGQIYVWGLNDAAGIGNPSPGNDQLTPAPVALPGGIKAKSISAFGLTLAAIGADDKLYMWGSNSNSQVWGGSSNMIFSPTQVAMPGNDAVTSVSVSTCAAAVGGDGKLFTWGDLCDYFLGGPGHGPQERAMPSGVKAKAVSTGGLAGLVIGDDDVAYSWGDNSSGRLGDGTKTSRAAIAPVHLPTGVKVGGVAANYLDGFALAQDGTLYGWGDNSYGGIGDGTKTTRLTPVSVGLPGEPGGAKATQLAASSGYSTLAMLAPPPAAAPVFQPIVPPKKAVYGTPFSLTVTANSTPPPTYALASGAPYWLSIDPSGRVNGTVPADIAGFSFAVTATNFSGTVTSPPVVISAGPPNLVTNGSFEDPALPQSTPQAGYTADATAITGWTVGGTGVTLTGSGYWSAEDSDQSLELSEQTSGPGSMTQTILTTPGAPYTLSWYMAGDPTCGPPVKSMKVLWNGTQIATPTFNTAGFSTTAMGWVQQKIAVTATGDTSTLAFADDDTDTSGCGTAIDDVALNPAHVVPPVFSTTAPPPALTTTAGSVYSAAFFASGIPTYSLVNAPAWLSVTAYGAVTGTPPAGTTSFSYGVAADNADGHAAVGSFTVQVVPVTTVSGKVVDNGAAATSVAGAVVEACAAGGQCRRATTAVDGTFSVGAPVGSSVGLTAFPPAGSPDDASATTSLTVPAAGIRNETVALNGTAPLQPGLLIGGTTAPTVYWGNPAPTTLTGCPNGFASVTVIGQNMSTGDFESRFVHLTETPAGSGTYSGDIPPMVPIHGPVQFSSSVTCPGNGPIRPGAGPTDGGGGVIVTGSGFTGATGMSFGGVPATTFSVVSDEVIKAVVPPGATPGPVTVTVYQGTSGVAAGQYTYTGVSSVAPSTGPAAGGTPVVIKGTGLASAVGVNFGTVGAAFHQVSDTEIDAVAPPGTGTQDITVETVTNGITSASSTDKYAYTGAAAPAPTEKPAATQTRNPTSTAVTEEFTVSPAALPTAAPAAGPAGSSAVQQIEDYIKQQTDATLSRIETKLDADIRAAIATLDAGCSGDQDTINALAYKVWTSNSMQSAVFVDTALAVEAVLAGTIEFGPIAAAIVSIEVAAMVQMFAYTRIQALLREAFHQCADMNGYIDPSGTVLDTNGNPVSGATVTLLRADTSAGPFAPLDPAGPGIRPAVNPQTTGADGIFHWDVFSGWYEIQATASGCADPQDPGRTAVTIGPYPVPPPQVGLTIGMACAIEAPPKVPAVQSLSRVSGTAAGGDTVTVAGSGFTPQSTVDFGGVSAAKTMFVSPNALQVVTPAWRGTVDVTVKTAGGNSATSSADRYFFGSAPVVSGLSPNAGSAAGGQLVTVAGSGFTGATGVVFGLTPATGVTVVSDSRLRVVAPAGAVGSVDVTVVNPIGVSIVTAADRYAYSTATGNTVPTFTAASPLTTATAGAHYGYAFAAAGSPAPTFALAAGAPAWLSINTATGVVDGTVPAGATSFSFSVSATNAAGSVTAGPFTVHVGSAPPPPPTGPTQVYRDAGSDRVSTGIVVSQQRWAADSAGAVVLATSRNFPDALAGGPLAAKKGGPLLLTDGSATELDPRVLGEIRRVLPADGPVYVLGGDSAVAPAIVSQLRGLHYSVTQFKGADRADTALLIARDGVGSPQHVVLATGTGYADALAAGPYAAGPFADAPGSPAAIVLSTDASLDALTAAFLSGKTVATVGTQAAKAWPHAAKTFSGTDRFDTAAQVAYEFTGAFADTRVGVANAITAGGNPGYPDALTGGAFMASVGGPIVLVDGVHGILPQKSAAILAMRSTNARADIFGGTSVIDPSLAARIVAALKGVAKF